MEFQCPHCQVNLSSDDQDAGKVMSCPACNQSFQVPGIEFFQATTTKRAAAKTNRAGWAEEDHANVNFWVSLGVGTGITVVFLLLLVPFKGKGFSDIFLQRGWVNYAEVFLFLWGMVILFMKWKKTRRQSQAMLLDILPTSVAPEIDTQTVPSFIDHIYKLPVHLRDSLMVNRIRKALELFEKRNNNGEVVTLLNSQSDIDANRISGSYTLLKVFLWAIPILGFIGTVQGLSIAVSSLSAGSTDPEALKASINNLTGGLGVAFDTTLLGLVLSMIMSFPMAAMQKQEEEVLTLIDVFCNEKLLPRLNDSKSSISDSLLTQAESIPALAASLTHAHEIFLDRLQEASGLLTSAGTILQNRLDTHQVLIETTFQNAVNRLTNETRDAFVGPSDQMTQYFANLSKGIESLNKTLEKLGGETIVVQKKGFFSR